MVASDNLIKVPPLFPWLQFRRVLKAERNCIRHAWGPASVRMLWAYLLPFKMKYRVKDKR